MTWAEVGTIVASILAVGALISGRFGDINKRIDTLDNGLNKRIDDLRADMNARFAEVRTDLHELRTLLQEALRART